MLSDIYLEAQEDTAQVNKNEFRFVLLTAVGSVLELYDYTLFLILLPVFAEPLFGMPLMEAVFVGYILFAISFLVSPFGAIIWGFIGDKFGRKVLLSNSLLLMAVPSIIIALMPTHHLIGGMAIFLVFISRCLQVLSASGEKQGAKIFLIEHLGAKKFGLASSSLSIASAFGVLLAMLMGYVCSKFPQYPNLWRIAFLIGGMLAVVSYYIRKDLREIKTFKADSKSSVLDFKSVLKANRYNFIIAFLLASLMGIFTYFLHGFMGVFAIKYGASKSESYWYAMNALAATAVAAFVAGLLIDNKKLGDVYKLRVVIIRFLVIFAVLAPMLYHIILVERLAHILIWYGFLGASLGFYASVVTLLIAIMFPNSQRCRNSLFAYSLGFAIFGGTTPLVLKVILEYSIAAPIIYFEFAVLVVCLTLVKAKRINTIN